MFTFEVRVAVYLRDGQKKYVSLGFTAKDQAEATQKLRIKLAEVQHDVGDFING